MRNTKPRGSGLYTQTGSIIYVSTHQSKTKSSWTWTISWRCFSVNWSTWFLLPSDIIVSPRTSRKLCITCGFVSWKICRIWLSLLVPKCFYYECYCIPWLHGWVAYRPSFIIQQSRSWMKWISHVCGSTYSFDFLLTLHHRGYHCRWINKPRTTLSITLKAGNSWTWNEVNSNDFQVQAPWSSLIGVQAYIYSLSNESWLDCRFLKSET